MQELSLYELNNQLISAVNSAFESTDEDGCVEADFFKQLEALKVARDEKLENLALYIKSLEATAGAIKAEEEKLKERRETIQRKATSIKNYIASSMQYAGENKFESARCKLSFRTSKSVEVYDEALIPREFFTETVTYKLSKSAIKEAIAGGAEVAGAAVVENKNLQIK